MLYKAPGKCTMDGAVLVEVSGEEHQDTGKHSHHDHHKMMLQDFKKRFIGSLLLTIPILILSPLLQNIFGFAISFTGDKYILFLLSSIIFFWGGFPFLKGFIDELKKKNPGMMTLIAIAISIAYFYSSAVVFGLKGKYFFWELATLIDIMLLGHYIEMKSIMGASKALEKLVELLPDKAHLIKNGEIIEIEVNKLKNGDIVLVKAGEKIPADGVIVKGESYVNESMLTGESKPVKKGVGEKVVGGSINGDSVIEIQITGTGENTYLSKVIELVKEAQASKSNTEKLADKAAKYLTFIAIFSGITTFLYWYFSGAELSFAIERFATVMVIACPHALGLAIPLVNAVSTSLAAKNGLLIRNRTAFENSGKITTIVFDKTGTLTKGEFGVSSVIITDKKYSEKEILKYASAIEVQSEHPIAKGIVLHTQNKGISFQNAENIEVIKGEGIKGEVEGKTVYLLSQKSVKKRGIEIPEETQFDDVATLVFVVIENKLVGIITLEDQIRPESYDAIRSLQEMGIKCFILTGDNKKIAEKVSNQLKLDGFFAEVLPHEKQMKVKELQKSGEFVAMTGDGINDAPALATADVGIAVGSGTDVAVETADIILVNSNPKDVVTLIRFGKETYIKMIQNLFWATAYNVLAIPLAAGVLYNVGIIVSPAIGAALMSVSTVVVAINAKLLNIKK